MKTFKDLEFKPMLNSPAGKHAIMNFDNGYGVSVIIDDSEFSNGVDTYTAAVLIGGMVSFNSSDILRNVPEAEVNRMIMHTQLLKKEGEVK